MKKPVFVFCFFFLFVGLFAEEIPANKKKVCLNMIVKNETRVITRCLASAKPIIDYWVIVDTGSTDGTQELIKDFMKDVPGDLYERPWKNFGHNRNEALQLAKNKGDYILFIDADEIFAYDPDFKMPPLDKDFYHVMTSFGGSTYARVQLVKNDLDWKWIGVLHEAIDCPKASSNAVLKGIKDVVFTDGARSQDPQKYQKDAKLLEDALKEEPNNTRYMFYLAQSYKDAGEYENAIKNYEKRISMGGWDEEIFWSMYQIGIMKDALKKPQEEVLTALYQAYHQRPVRAEPLYYLTNYYRRQGNYAAGYLIGTIAEKIPFPRDILFIEKWMYDYGIALELSICAYWIGKYEECLKISMNILTDPNIPQHVRECVERNANFARNKLVEILVANPQIMDVKPPAAAVVAN